MAVAIYHEGKPQVPGLYVAYVNDDLDPKGARYAKRIFLVWDGRWNYPLSDQRYRGHVYQCVGPLPAMELK